MGESHISRLWVPILLRGTCLATGAAGEVEEAEHEQEVHVLS
jgi:hypothetical protein